MRAYRLTKSSLTAALDGEGARLFGGRWNSPGRPVIYSASSLSLAMLEVLVHIQDAELLRHSYAFRILECPDGLSRRLDLGELPYNWQQPEHPALKDIGDRWLISSTSVVLEVPSAVIPLEWNLLFNPLHPDWSKVLASQPIALSIDPRLIV